MRAAAKLTSNLYEVFDFLDMPVVVVRGGELAYANAALERLLGVSRAELIGRRAEEVVCRFVASDVFDEVLRQYGVLDASSLSQHGVWMELQTPRGPSLACIQSHPGRAAGEWIFVVVTAPGAAEARELTRALAQSAGALLRAKDERDVLEIAMDVLLARGFFCAVARLEGEWIRFGPMRNPPGVDELALRHYGVPTEERLFPRSALAHLEEAFEARRGTFHADVMKIIRAVHSPEMAAAFAERTPRNLPCLDAPIFVEDEPYGLLVAVGERVTPAIAASVELFAALVGSAIEVLRNAKRAAERLAEVQRLEKEKLQQERLAVLGEAAAVVSHEVRNPLGTIINAVAVLRRERVLSADGLRVIGMIEEEAQRLDRLVGDMLEFARPLEPKLGRLDLRAFARRAIDAWISSSPNARIRIELLPAPEVPPIQADADTLFLAVRNLLRNAVQASPPGGRVAVSVEAEGGWVVLSVDDEGPGIPEAEVEKIFAPFYTTRARGTGLGLAVVDRIAKLNGARVDVTRSRRGGACFRLRFRPAKP